jgi:hypothetical protein
MSDNFDLFRRLFPEPSPAERGFLEFHKENPHIYAEIVKRASRLLRAGARRVGIAMIFESMRYDYLIQTSGEPWKLNNTYRAYYVRLLVLEHPHFRDIIEMRRSRADNLAA